MLTTEDFPKTMRAIASKLLKEQDRSNWREFGFLPSSRRLYALWRERGGQSFNRFDFETALGEMQESQGFRHPGSGETSHEQGPCFAPLDNGSSWVYVPGLLWNCCGAGAVQEQREYAIAVMRQVEDELTERGASMIETARGLEEMRDALVRGADGKQVVHIGHEWRLFDRESGILEEGEMLFDDEHVVEDNE